MIKKNQRRWPTIRLIFLDESHDIKNKFDQIKQPRNREVNISKSVNHQIKKNANKKPYSKHRIKKHNTADLIYI